MGLNKVGAGGFFLCQPMRAPIERRRKRVFGRTEENPRWRCEFAATFKAGFVAQGSSDVEQREAIEIKHRFGLRMVAHLHTIARETQKITRTHGGRS